MTSDTNDSLSNHLRAKLYVQLSACALLTPSELVLTIQSEVFTNVFARIRECFLTFIVGTRSDLRIFLAIQNELYSVSSASFNLQTQNCIGANHRNRLTVWLFYLFAMVYDVITMSISTYYLLVGVPSFYRMSSFIKLMFYDGIGYFFFLTVANVFNLILYRASNEEIQSSGATIGYVVTWIMAQRILIHLRDEAARLHSQTISVQTITRTTTHNLTSPREIAQAMRTRFTDTKNRDRLDDEFSRSTPGGASEEKSSVDDRRDSASTNSRPSKDYGDMDLDIKVQVQQSVTVDYVPNPYGRETYRTPKGFQTAPR
ncbi:hypothetical protein QCA50_013375 [Cerrena zonata]|uniref:Uncharacterized protein n=1 Tax=Cerrena zonata TaxID=2478898 RepID=A0AAW0FXC4_9APHY